jgi:hypothetical protein
MSTPRTGLVAQLPFLSVPKASVPPAVEIFLQRSECNICDQRDGLASCDTASGLYYTSEDVDAPALCPRHFYQLHFGPRAPCVLRTKEELRRAWRG